MTKSLNELQSQTISWLRFPLIMCVVFIHNPQLDTKILYPIISRDTISLSLLFDYFRIWGSEVFSRIAVPCFFVISGFLFFMKTPELTKCIYTKKIKRRFFSLLIPYVIWNIIPLIIMIVVKLNKPLLHGWTWGEYFSYISQQFSDHGLLNIFWAWNVDEGRIPNWLCQYVEATYPYNFPLWYVRNLIIICILTPLLYFVLKRFGKIFIAILIVFYFGNITSNLPGTDTTTLLFFGTGAYIAINRENIIEKFRKIEKPFYVLTIFFMIIATFFIYSKPTIGRYFLCGYVLTGVVSAFNLASRLLESNKVKVHYILTSSVFFIYAFHTNWLVGIYDRVINKVLTIIGIDPINIVTYITTPFVKAGICIVICVLIDKYLPKVGKVLTGNRS